MFEFFVTTYGTQLLGLILCAVFGCLGHALKGMAAQYINDDTKRAVARTAAQFVEQTWKDIHGADKLRTALETAESLLVKRGIPFDADEMKILIEAAVGEFNDVFNAPLEIPEGIDADDLTDEQLYEALAQMGICHNEEMTRAELLAALNQTKTVTDV